MLIQSFHLFTGFDASALLNEPMGIALSSIYCAYGNKAQPFLEALRHLPEDLLGSVISGVLGSSGYSRGHREPFQKGGSQPACPERSLRLSGWVGIPQFTRKRARSWQGDNRKIRAYKKNVPRQTERSRNKEQIPADCDIPGISCALHNFLEGLAVQARGDVCLSELLAISEKGVQLLPPAIKS